MLKYAIEKGFQNFACGHISDPTSAFRSKISQTIVAVALPFTLLSDVERTNKTRIVKQSPMIAGVLFECCKDTQRDPYPWLAKDVHR